MTYDREPHAEHLKALPLDGVHRLMTWLGEAQRSSVDCEGSEFEIEWDMW